MTRSAKHLSRISLIWLVLLLFSICFGDELFAALWVLVGVWWLALYAAGATLAVWALVLLVKAHPSRRPGFAIPLLVPITAFLLQCLVGTGWVFALRFSFSRPRYEAAVARIQAAAPAQRDKVAGRDYNVDPGPPLRVAFVQPGSVLDNYSAIVYDPTGLVMKANQFKGDWSNWNDPKLAHVKKLFGGDLVWAEHLGGPWYRCGFT